MNHYLRSRLMETSNKYVEKLRQPVAEKEASVIKFTHMHTYSIPLLPPQKEVRWAELTLSTKHSIKRKQTFQQGFLIC